MVDLLRVLATLLVLAFHFAAPLGERLAVGESARELFRSLGKVGSTGTDMLFILSGFLLTRSLAKGTSWKTALQSRILGIYPGFLVVLMTYLVLSPLAPQLRKVPEDTMAAVQYLLSNVLLLPGILPIAPMVTMSWALSYVIYSLVLLALIYRFAGLGGRSPVSRSLVWGVAIVSIFVMVDRWGFALGRLIFFPLGALMAETEPLLADLPAAMRYLLLPGGFVMLGAWEGYAPHAIGLSLIVAAGLHSTVLNKVADSRAWATAAGGSYTVCLTHGFVIHGIRLAAPSQINGVGATALFTLGIAVSYVWGLVWDAYVFSPTTRFFSAKFGWRRRDPQKTILDLRQLPAGETQPIRKPAA